MRVKIKETGEIETLDLLNYKTGENFIEDWIHNAGGFANDDFLPLDDGTADYETNQENYTWWLERISENKKIDEWLELAIEEKRLELLGIMIAANDLETALTAGLKYIERNG